MKKETIRTHSSDASKNIHNSGGPRSRVRSEKIESDFIAKTEAVSSSEVYELILPKNEIDIEKWILDVGSTAGFKNLKKIIQAMKLPDENMIVQVQSRLPSEMESHLFNAQPVNRILRNALVLSMCNNFSYHPDAPKIFTRKRLERRIKLITINLEKYYEMD